MAGKLLDRKAQIAVELETTEGTAETLVDADATMLCYDPGWTPDIERFKRQPSRATLSQLAAVVGKQTGGVTWKAELKGSGSVATEPAWSDALQGCGFAKATVSSIAIGAVTSGPFEPGETITGGTSGGTGRVVGEVANGASAVPYVVLSGTLQSGDLLTGGTSGATATASAGPSADKGFEYRPASSSLKVVTVGIYKDGTRALFAGARGNVKIDAVVGEPVFLDFAFEGVYGGFTDTALLSPTYESTIPKAFLNVGASMLDLATIFTTLGIDMQNVLAQRGSANAAKGVLSVLLTGRDPVATLDPEMELVTDHDFFGKLIAGTTGRLYAELDGAAGQKITIASPRAQYADVGQAEREGILTAPVTLDLISASVSAGDDEVQIGML